MDYTEKRMKNLKNLFEKFNSTLKYNIQCCNIVTGTIVFRLNDYLSDRLLF